MPAYRVRVSRKAQEDEVTVYPLVAPKRLSVDAVADRAGVHPDLVRRYLALGLLDAVRDKNGLWWLAPNGPATVARIERLRAGLSLNYAALGLVLDLLDRITELEAALRSPAAARHGSRGRREPRWISTG